MTRDRAAEVVAKAVIAAHDVYWAAYDVEGRAVDPAALDASEGFLDDADEAAFLVGSLAADRGISHGPRRASWRDAMSGFVRLRTPPPMLGFVSMRNR